MSRLTLRTRAGSPGSVTRWPDGSAPVAFDPNRPGFPSKIGFGITSGLAGGASLRSNTHTIV